MSDSEDNEQPLRRRLSLADELQDLASGSDSDSDSYNGEDTVSASHLPTVLASPKGIKFVDSLSVATEESNDNTCAKSVTSAMSSGSKSPTVTESASNPHSTSNGSHVTITTNGSTSPSRAKKPSKLKWIPAKASDKPQRTPEEQAAHKAKWARIKANRIKMKTLTARKEEVVDDASYWDNIMNEYNDAKEVRSHQVPALKDGDEDVKLQWDSSDDEVRRTYCVVCCAHLKTLTCWVRI